MDRRAFITMVGGSILAAPSFGEAQQPGKIARIGYLAGNLASGPPPKSQHFVVRFCKSMRTERPRARSYG